MAVHKIEATHTVEFYKVWQHPKGPIFNIGEKAGVSKSEAEEIEQRGIGVIIHRPDWDKDGKTEAKVEAKAPDAPVKNKQVGRPPNKK